MRIIQPDHPLFDQIVPVLRAITSRGAAVPRWLVAHPNGSTLVIPQVWATTEVDPSAPCPNPPPLPVDVPSLMALAKLVQQILATPFQEQPDVYPTFTPHSPHASLVEPVVQPAEAGVGLVDRSV